MRGVGFNEQRLSDAVRGDDDLDDDLDVDPEPCARDDSVIGESEKPF